MNRVARQRHILAEGHDDVISFRCLKIASDRTLATTKEILSKWRQLVVPLRKLAECMFQCHCETA